MRHGEQVVGVSSQQRPVTPRQLQHVLPQHQRPAETTCTWRYIHNTLSFTLASPRPRPSSRLQIPRRGWRLTWGRGRGWGRPRCCRGPAGPAAQVSLPRRPASAGAWAWRGTGPPATHTGCVDEWTPLSLCVIMVLPISFCEAQGKGRARGGPRRVTQRSFIDGGWWKVDI